MIQFNSIAEAGFDGPLHLAIGMFDGVHLGHRAVIEPAVAAARRENGVAAVLTFRPHPSVLFRPEAPTRLIHDSATQVRLLSKVGLDAVIIERFTHELAKVEAEQFLPGLKRQLPMLKGVYVGENFRFGAKRRGDVSVLSASGHELGISVRSAARITAHAELVSSTRVRAHLEAGEMEAANALLGYRYFSEGVVTPGKRLGRTIGFPTLNITWSPELRPRFGVYAVAVTAADRAQASLRGVANYGLRPTVENSTEPKLEVHVLGDCPYNAGDWIAVEWTHFIRPEMKFGSLEELRAQIAKDVETARR